MPARIILNDADIATARELGSARNTANRSAGNPDRKFQRRDPEEVNFEGTCGEIAFCRLFGIPFDATTHNRSSAAGTDEGDCVLKGKKIDVKTSDLDTAHLKAPIWTNRTAVDYYALMIGKCPQYELRGFMSSADLIRPERIMDMGYGPLYAAPQDDLLLCRGMKPRDPAWKSFTSW